MRNDIKTFWNWFEQNNADYLSLDNLDKKEKERLLDSLLDKLHKYCESLFFQVGGHPGEVQELIITAEGDEDYFGEVERLVSGAPGLDGWNVLAFIPPRSTEFWTDFEGVVLKPAEMWFLPLNNPKEPNSIGLRICMKDHELIKDKEYFMSAVYKVLDTIVGEKAFALDIGYVETNILPENPQDKKMIELTKLAKYIDWKKKQSK